MDITFLIGNGFDLNLGLNTRYSDFLKEYLQDNPEDTEEIKAFKADIIEKEQQDKQKGEEASHLWSNAEMAFGLYTDDVVNQQKTVETFFERYDDFCIRLASYLQAQENRILVQGDGKDFINAIQNFHKGLTEAQVAQVNKAEALFDGGYVFNFIIFNYTEIIDKILQTIRDNRTSMGTRTVKSTNKSNSIGKVIHVHGTTTQDMVFGVNDETQIANMELFNNALPFYLNSLIKQKTNHENEARIDEKTHEIIKNSSFVYIYGMSLGDTDAIWWERVIERMKAQTNTHVFIHGFDAPKNRLIQRQRWIYEYEKKRQFLAFAKGDTTGLADRIHIVNADIFEQYSNIIPPPIQEQTVSTDGNVELSLPV